MPLSPDYPRTNLEIWHKESTFFFLLVFIKDFCVCVYLPCAPINFYFAICFPFGHFWSTTTQAFIQLQGKFEGIHVRLC